MRLFFALALDEPVRASATRVADMLQQRLERARCARAVKWVERENLHITMRFLGEVDEKGAHALFGGACERLLCSPFDLSVGGAGAFPPSGPPHALWIGTDDPTGVESVRAVFALLEQRLATLGFEPEPRAHAPHMTLGRVREINRSRGRELRQWLSEVPGNLGTLHVSRVTLYRSHLSSSGPRYEVVAEVPLA